MHSDPRFDSATVLKLSSQLSGLMRISSKTIIEIGKSLKSVRQKLGTSFQEWCETKTAFSFQTAENYIRVAETFSTRSLNIENFDKDALFALSCADVQADAAEYASKLSKTVRIDMKIVREILAIHNAPPEIIANEAMINRHARNQIAIKAESALSESLEVGDSIYLTAVDDDEEKTVIGTLTNSQGKTITASGEKPCDVILKLTDKMPEKQCNKCGEVKKLTEYSTANRQSDLDHDGHIKICKKCIAESSRHRTMKSRKGRKANVLNSEPHDEPPFQANQQE